MISENQWSDQSLLKRFNRLFPDFYEQYASSDTQRQNLQLAYQIHRTKQAVIHLSLEGSRTVIYFANRNHSYLLSDLFGVMAAYRVAVHSLSLYGQIRPPMLVFVKLVLSQDGMALSKKMMDSVQRALVKTLNGEFAVEEMLTLEFDWGEGLKDVQTSFYTDNVFNLPALLVEATSHPGLLYKVMHAIWGEDLLVINTNLMLWRGRVRLLLYLLGPNGNLIPDYLGQRLAQNVKDRILEIPASS